MFVPLLAQSYTPDGVIGSLTDANNNTTTFTPDGFDRLSTTTYPDSSTEVLGYDADDNVLTRKTRAGATVTFTYDTLNRLSTKAAPSEPTVSYAYDLAGHLAGVSDNSAAITSPSTAASYASNLTYDQLNRPLSVNWSPVPSQATPSAAASATFGYGYDATNRRVSQSASDKSWWSYPTAATNLSYTANNLNQYTTVGSAHPTYDGNGNLAADGSFIYCYDAENRLTGIVQGSCTSPTSTVATYATDVQGRRKSKTVGGTATIFVTDADNREVLEYNGTTGAIQTWYSFAPVNAFGPDAVLNQMNVSAATRATLVPDIQGSIIGTLDASSGALSKFGYQTYGENPALASGPYRYTARRFDAETAGSAAQPSGLYYYRARMYSPAWGRFLQVDPIGYVGGSNLYRYVGNDPLNSTDATGLSQDNADQASNQPATQTSAEVPSTPTTGSSPSQTSAPPPDLETPTANTRLAWLLSPIEMLEGPCLVAMGSGGCGGPGGGAVSGASQGGTISENAARGLSFESSVLQELNAAKNTSTVTVPGVGRSVPDSLLNGILEIKSGVEINFTLQMRVQASYAAMTGSPYNIIVSPSTQRISQSLRDAVAATGGTIARFDPATRTFAPFP